jgi:autotransporter-associated beta strand protein
MKVFANWMILRANIGAFLFALIVLVLGTAGRNASAVTLYWDNDANATGDNTTTGAGLGGTGTWDTSSLKWFDGTTDVAWMNGSDAVFWGTAGSPVTLSAPETVNNVTFKTPGYTVQGVGLTPPALTLTGSVTVDSGLVDTIGSPIMGTAGLVKNGAGTLHLEWTGNSYTGGTVVNAGTLGFVAGSLGAVPPSPTIDVTINNAATLRVNATPLNPLNANHQFLLGPGGGTINTNTHDFAIAGVISGSSLTKSNTGTLTLMNADTYTGGTTVTGGTLLVNNSSGSGTGTGTVTLNTGTVLGGTGTIASDVSNSGNVDAGSFLSGVPQVGTLHVGGNYTQAAGGIFSVELAGLAAHDELIATGSATLGGTLAVSLTSGFTPAVGNTFEIMTASGFGGSKFATTNLPALSGGLSWNVNYGTTNVVLSVSIPGDFNNDSAVNAADYATWRKGLGTTYTQGDYDLWRAHFGQPGGPGAGLSSGGAVPEPASLLLSVLGGALTLFGVARCRR